MNGLIGSWLGTVTLGVVVVTGWEHLSPPPPPPAAPRGMVEAVVSENQQLRREGFKLRCEAADLAAELAVLVAKDRARRDETRRLLGGLPPVAVPPEFGEDELIPPQNLPVPVAPSGLPPAPAK